MIAKLNVKLRSLAGPLFRRLSVSVAAGAFKQNLKLDTQSATSAGAVKSSITRNRIRRSQKPMLARPEGLRFASLSELKRAPFIAPAEDEAEVKTYP